MTSELDDLISDFSRFYILTILYEGPSHGYSIIQKFKKRIGREISPREVDEIALVAPKSTINIIRDFRVMKKNKVRLPKMVKEILRCSNPACITNSIEPVKTAFQVENEDPILLRCYYCSTILEKDVVVNQF